MALLLPPGTRNLDADGNPTAGTIRVRNANTTTLSDVFSDADLTVPLTNPVECNAAGWPTSDGSTPTLVFAAVAEYDVAFFDASGSTLATFEDVSPYGDSGGGSTVTVSGNGRYLFTGAAGAVMLQVGDPDPDNSGGTLTIEGWAGTQLDSLTLDGAVVNTTGRLKENSRKLQGTIHTEATQVTAQATVDIPLPNTPSGVRRWRIHVFDMSVSAAAQPRLRLSYGGSVKTGASDYAYRIQHNNIAGGVFGPASDDAADFAVLHGENWNTLANKPYWMTLEVYTPNSGSDATVVRLVHADAYDAAATPIPTQSMGTIYGLGGYGRADAIRIYMSSGTITCKYQIEPLYGLGD